MGTRKPIARDVLARLSPEEREEFDALVGYPRTLEAYAHRVNPSLRWYRHVRAMGDVADQIVGGQLRRVIVLAPPRHHKSETFSRLLSSRYLRLFPQRWVALASYGATLAESHARKAREYFSASGGVLSGESAAVTNWETTRGGGMWACGAGGTATGKGYDLGIVDDPIKDAADSLSATIRARFRDWWHATWTPRANTDRAVVVLIMQRWGPDDPVGWLLGEESHKPEGWTILQLPLLTDDTPPLDVPPTCRLLPDWRGVDEPLCPEIRDLAACRKTLELAGPYWGAAQWQQRPRAREGTVFKREWFPIVPDAPADLQSVRAWDLGATALTGNRTAGVKIGLHRGTYYVQDAVAGAWDIGARNAVIQQTAALDGRNVSIRGPQDPGAAGKESAQAFVRMLSGYTVWTQPVSGSKFLRASPFAAQAAAGNVRLVAGVWNAEYLTVLTNFLGIGDEEDDLVDASADAFNALTGTTAGLDAVPVSLPQPSYWRLGTEDEAPWRLRDAG